MSSFWNFLFSELRKNFQKYLNCEKCEKKYFNLNYISNYVKYNTIKLEKKSF